MAALTRPTEATYAIHENVTVKTTDRQEHTFCGIMFPIECKAILPIDHIIIKSISVRGRLGPISVYVTSDGSTKNQEDDENHEQDNRDDDDDDDDMPEHHRYLFNAKWEKIYSQTLPSSFRKLQKLDLSSDPITLKPNHVRGIYIHSTLPGDQAIVYDNHYSNRKNDTPDDNILRIGPAVAHLSTVAFGSTPIWGWGTAWRLQRKFVGSVDYGVVYRLWHPREHLAFGGRFRDVTRVLFMCQRRWESPMSRLPDECIYYILNMCRWDWVGDGREGMAAEVVKRKKRELLLLENKKTAGGSSCGDNCDGISEKKATWKVFFVFLMCIPPIRALLMRRFHDTSVEG